jgi:large subunit ribosomal protein L5
MRRIRVAKVTLNIGCAGDLEKIERAKRLLEKLTGRRVVVTKSKRRSTFGIARGKPVGVKVTLRGKPAVKFLKLALQAVENRLSATQFDREGNFSFGVREYIDLPGIRYDHEIGMLGLDVCVSLERPGFRIKRRRIRRAKVPPSHGIGKEEAIAWARKSLGVKMGEG